MVLAVIGATHSLEAQSADGASLRSVALRREPLDVPPSVGAASSDSRPMRSAPPARRAPWWAPLASLAVPGTGQIALGQQRSVAYAVAEGYLIVQALSAQRDVNQSIRAYQSVANEVARKAFGGSRPTGPWEYYEDLERFDASGRFDMTPGGAIDPETDLGTFNGQAWLLARRTYWRDPNTIPPTSSPEYQRALAFYVSRAWSDEFRWSWRDAQLQKDVYRTTINAANRSNQRKTNLITVIGANHLASLVDAYINVRIRRYGGVSVAGLRLDGVDTRVSLAGDPADNLRTIRASLRFVPPGPGRP